MRDRKLFAIRVKGTSMNLCEVNRKRIEDGDYIVVDPNDRSYMNKDKVLVVVDGVATVKLYQKLNEESIGLFPVSSEKKHKPIYLTPSDEFIICGKAIDVFKNIDSVHGSEYPVEYLE